MEGGTSHVEHLLRFGSAWPHEVCVQRQQGVETLCSVLGWRGGLEAFLHGLVDCKDGNHQPKHRRVKGLFLDSTSESLVHMF